MCRMVSSSAKHARLGYRAFDWLKAEREIAWLDHVFVAPPDFDAMAGMRSIVVFGAGGSGNGAFSLALARYADREDDAPAQLIVDWRPALPQAGPAGSQMVRLCMAQALDACALALLRYLGRRPEMFAAAPRWAQETAIWFAHQY